MSKFSLALLLFLSLSLKAGVNSTPPQGPERVVFTQSKTYPYIFVPIPYLELGQPPALRFLATPSLRRNPPPVPAPTPSPTPHSTPVPSNKQEPKEPAFPPPQPPQPTPTSEALDLSKYPSEVSEFFKNPYNIPKYRRRFLEPVFEPGQPPPSKATYDQQ